jgi:hypothetical protein
LIELSGQPAHGVGILKIGRTQPAAGHTA